MLTSVVLNVAFVEFEGFEFAVCLLLMYLFLLSAAHIFIWIGVMSAFAVRSA